MLARPSSRDQPRSSDSVGERRGARRRRRGPVARRGRAQV